MKNWVKKKWPLIVTIIQVAYSAGIGLPFYLMTLDCLKQHWWSPFFLEVFTIAYFLGMIKIDQYANDVRESFTESPSSRL